jgi:membrane protein YqaA with SNARE-associated domain
MKSLWIKIGGALKSLQVMLVGFGAAGIFIIALLDAALIPLPGGPDAVLILLSHQNHLLMPLGVAAAIIGSTIGSLFPYYVARASGKAALRRFNPERRNQVLHLLQRYDVWALLLAAVLPPPFPFKLFVLSAGVFRMRLWRFICALVVGRGLRFILEGLAAVHYGAQAAELFKQHYPKIGIGVAAAIIAILVVNNLIRRRRPATS